MTAMLVCKCHTASRATRGLDCVHLKCPSFVCRWYARSTSIVRGWLSAHQCAGACHHTLLLEQHHVSVCTHELHSA